jgi:hypothetical protein
MTHVKNNNNNDYKKHYYKHEPEPHYRMVYWHDRPLRAGEKAYMERYLFGLKGERSEPILSHKPSHKQSSHKPSLHIQQQTQTQTQTQTHKKPQTLSDKESQILYEWLNSLPDAN